ncbi:mannitol dehydrogenase family protein [Kushneria marisflavi]|uniref:Mannitol dehydrogenase n=1 Tax=Kushneria marisflavi TaxID=157779 RepID=A0A240UQT3_9GAMM|nr:mannitol dehydrogenase family protein [Kushneria marisflavi]ART63838.1 mannitol dehydrogenase [Kushneria marisflavi]RKD85543.1 fructuronate reductase [Kushneria marisflavi]
MSASDNHDAIEVVRIASGHAPERIGIVHLGLGAFHRAHQAQVIEQCIARGERDWGICSVNIRGNRALVETLRDQGFRYHLAEYTDRTHVTLREIRAINETLFTGTDPQGQQGEDLSALLDRLSNVDTRIVTLTVTEKGYYLSPGEGTLLSNDPAIVADIAHPEAPCTAPGILVEALARRRQAGIAPFTVLCCDNMPDNGARTRQAVVALAERRDAALAEWIDTHVAFPSSMVDRIVPAMNDAALERLRSLGCDDPAAVVSEAFLQWVIEDHFPQGRPDWGQHGVEMVEDVGPFETMKLRMLNGAHSLLAYTGPLMGLETVAEAVGDPLMQKLLRRYMLEEAAPTLSMPESVSLEDYARALMARFGNDSLHHRLHQIAMDGSQKLPQRWLRGGEARLAATQDEQALCATVFGVAAWIRYTRGIDEQGRAYPISDPMADQLAQCHAHEKSVDRAAAVMGIEAIFSPSLVRAPRFGEQVQKALSSIEQLGMRAALEQHLAGV